MPLLRKLLPWAASILAHAGLVLVPVALGPAALGRAPAAAPAERRVVLVFDSAPAPVPPDAAAERPAADAMLAPSGIALPRSLVTPEPSRIPVLPPAASEATLVSGRVSTARSSVAPGLPSPGDVLAALPEPANLLQAGAVPAAVPAAAQAAAESAPMGEEIAWQQGAARTVVRRVSPRFPSVLSAAGQEVECEATITVTPLGTVVDVEITRSSGYTEVDAGVEAALRQYVFSRAEGRQNVSGTVTFQFRLERRD